MSNVASCGLRQLSVASAKGLGNRRRLMSRRLMSRRVISKQSISRQVISRSILAIAAGGTASLTAGAYGQNNVSTYTGPGGTTNAPTTGYWSAGSSWASGAVPTSAATTELDFGGSGSTAYTSTNNISAGTFVLTEIQLNSTASATEVIAANASANTLTFNTSGSVTPQILQNGTGAFNISDGIVIGGSPLTFGGNGTGLLTVSGAITGSSKAVSKIGTSTLALTGTSTYSGTTTVTGGTLTFSGGGAYSGAGAFTVGNASGAVMNVATTSTTVAIGSSSMIGSTGTSGALNVISGTLTTPTSSNLFIGDGTSSYGSYAISGGTATNAGVVVGYAASGVSGAATGSLVMTGGIMSIAGKLYIGDSGTAGGQTQGIATFVTGSVTETTNCISFGSTSGYGVGGSFNVGTLTSGNATFTSSYMYGATFGFTPGLTDTNFNSSINLNHGTLSVAGSILNQTSAGGGTAFINFNGGILQANNAINSSTFTLLPGGVTSANDLVYLGGANIDVVSGVTAILAANLNSASGNGIYAANSSGAFPITSGGGSGYIGAPLVTVTDNTNGSATGAQAVANISNGVVTGVTMTNPGQGYSIGDSLTFNFSGGGTANPANSFSYLLGTTGSGDVLSNTGAGLIKLDSGTLTVTGNENYNGPTNISGGTLQVGGSNTSGSLPSTVVNISSGASLQFARTDSGGISFPNTITGAGNVVQLIGTTTLTGNVTYAGATTVKGGRLIVTEPTMGNTAVNVSNGGVFNPQPGSGTITIGSGLGTVTVNGGGTLDLSDGSLGTLNINGTSAGTALILGNSSTGTPANLIFEIGQTVGSSDKIAVQGSVSVLTSGALISVAPLSSDSSLTLGNYTIITATGGGLNVSGISTNSPINFNGVYYDLTLGSSTSTSEVLTVAVDLHSVPTAYWSGAQNGVWSYTSSANSTAGHTNWQTDISSGVDTGYVPGKITNVFFTSNSGASQNLNTTLGADFTINSLNFVGNAMGPITIGGNNTLTINAAGLGVNTAGNGINMSSGNAVTINANVALGGSQNWSNNTGNGNALTVNGNVSGNSYALGLAGNAPITIAGNLAATASITDSVTAPVTLSGNVSGGTSITSTASGGLTLSGPNSFTGGVNTSGGALTLNSASALGSGPLLVTGGITLDNTSGAPVALTTGNSLMFYAPVSFTGSSDLNLGSGAVTLGNGSGVFTINASTLTLSGNVTDNGSHYTLATNGAGNLNLLGNVSGGVILNAAGPGAVTLTGTNTFTGSTNVSGGTVTYAGNGSSSGAGLWLVSGSGSNSAVFNLNSTGNFLVTTTNALASTSSIGMNGNGAINQTAGNVSLNYNSSYSNSYLWISGQSGSYGSYTITGGTLSNTINQSTGIVVGNDGLGSFVMTGGTVNLSRTFYIGDGTSIGSSGQGVATFVGGTFTEALNPLTVAFNGIQFGSNSGYGKGGALNIGTLAGGNGMVSLTTTTANNGGIHIQASGNTNGYINLNAGMLSVGTGIQEPANNIYSGTFIGFNGGTLRATGSFQLMNSSLGTSAATVFNGGAIIDITSANVASISTNLKAATGYGVYAPATSGAIAFNTSSASAGTGYVGAPLVNVSGGNGSGLQAIANLSGGAISAITITNPGVNYQPGDQIYFSFSGGGASSPASSFTYTLQPIDLQMNGIGGLTKIDTGTLVLSGSNTYTGNTVVSAGVLNLVGSASLPVGTNLSIGTHSVPAAVIVTSTLAGIPITVLQINALSLSGSTNAWTSKLDLGNGAAVIHAGSYATLVNQVKQGYNGGTWQSSGGVTSAAAAADTTYLTALGLISNNDGFGNPLYGNNSSLGSFENTNPQLNDVLIKYTYYGDTDLSGVVDGTDYSRVDTTYMNENFSNGVPTNPISGWFNGDFNYDGVVDGSDYTLMDNAYNNQGAALSSQIALATAQVAGTSAVPEPSVLSLLAIGAVGLLGRRRRA